MKKLPIGIQDYRELITNWYYYLDKTHLIYDIVTRNKYYFFARPRRFGKSLLISTMKYVFLWYQDLFVGTNIYEKWEWTKENTYPVIEMNFSDFTDKSGDIKKLKEHLFDSCYILLPGEDKKRKLSTYIKTDHASPLKAIIEHLYTTTGKQVVVLVDEYDKAILWNLSNPAKAEAVRDFFQGFYSPVKPMDEYIRFFRLSWLTKLMKMNLFSVLNNLKDVSFGSDYVNIVGYTQQELEQHFMPELKSATQQLELSFDEMFIRIKEDYNGFNFWNEKKLVYNPRDIHNFLDNKEFGYYRADTGIPSSIKEYIENSAHDIRDIVHKARKNQLAVSSVELRVEDIAKIKAEVLFFNSWYLTLKEQKDRLYVLWFPNKETESVFLEYFIWLTNISSNIGQLIFLSEKFVQGILSGDTDEMQESLQEYITQYLVDIPWERMTKNPEWRLKTMIWVLLKINTIKRRGEIPWLKQRSDLLVPISDTSIAILEPKVNSSLEEAMTQITQKYEPLARAKGYTDVTRIAIHWKWNKEQPHESVAEIEIVQA